MTIDYLKIISKNQELAQRLYVNPLLERFSTNQKFNNKINQEKDSIKQATVVKCYKEILFCFFIKNEVFTKIEILIKPHYYFNDNLHNANDFKVIDCIKTLTEIKVLFGFPAKELSILNIEFGVNIISPIDIKDLISCIIYHSKNEFINSSDNLRFSKISFKHNESGKANKYKQIKAYAKGLQYPNYTDVNTLRFEVKSKERKYIKKLGINIYDDLLKFETYRKLSEVIKAESLNLLILDIYNKGQNLTNKELLKLNEYRNSYKWVKALQGSRNLFNRHKTDYLDLLDKSGDNIHNKIKQLIKEKLNELLKTCADSTPKTKQKTCADSDVYIIGNCTQNKNKKCAVTGIDLSHEKGNPNYIRTVTLKHLKKYDKEKFELLALTFIPKTGKSPKYENNMISQICKNVRNAYYNPRKYKQSGYRAKRMQNQLKFDYEYNT